jgi:hypothetical protein
MEVVCNYLKGGCRVVSCDLYFVLSFLRCCNKTLLLVFCKAPALRIQWSVRPTCRTDGASSINADKRSADTGGRPGTAGSNPDRSALQAWKGASLDSGIRVRVSMEVGSEEIQ